MVDVEDPPVAKKKAAKPAESDAKAWTQKPIIVTMRGSADFKAWVERLARHDRSSVAEMCERAMIRYASAIGFSDTPPER